ncbi:MAG: group II intron reverse transcriptase/maturase [Planctomycetales bacterium]|nr:group II intron reverse transcriptase/maturase [Planctomycetales bacterium]
MNDSRRRSKAEMPEQQVRVGGGTAEGSLHARQTITACDESTEQSVMVTMEEVLSRGNMLMAFNRVVSNKGAPGIDGMTVDELWGYCRESWEGIREELLSGRYAPSPVRKVEIPKPGGKGVRMLGIPTVLDRLIQQALLQVLTRLYDPMFSDSSFGFRPGRSTHQALDRAKEHIAAGHRWVVDMDLEKFFDRVNHDILMSRLTRQIEDKRILKLIRGYLQAGIMEGGVISPRSEGTPQGGPLSPLLSNVLLDELDKELERRGHRFVRYADDCNIYVRSRKAGERVLDGVERFLTTRLRLVVNRDKSAVDRPWKRKFLGYTFTQHYQPRFKVAPESVKRLKNRLREASRKARGRSVRRVIAELQPVLIGWVSYYRKSEVKKTFEELDQWIRRKLRAILWRQWKRPWKRARELIRLGLDRVRAWTSATNGRGPWWNAGASHMNQAISTRWLNQLGLVSLVQKAHALNR